MLRPKSQYAPLLFLLVTAQFAFIACGNNQLFDSSTWLKSDSRTRGKMSQSLVNSQTLVGKNAEEVKGLLGSPEKDWGKVWQYQIDLGMPFKDSQNYGLQVHLNEDRRVQLVKIVD
jgi:hypothetical protein